MATTVRDKNSVIGRLVPFAAKGRTTGTITVFKSDTEECRQLNSEGFTIVHAVKASRKGEYSLKVKWSNPTTPDGAAAELLEIAQNAFKQSTNTPAENSV